MHLIDDQLIFKNNRKEYFKYNLVSDAIIKINVETYCEILFGQYNYRLRNLLDLSISLTSDRIFTSFYQNDSLTIYNLDGELIEKKADFFADLTPYSISVNESKNELWVASGGGQVVKCIDLGTQAQRFIIGVFHEETEVMSFPEDVFVFNDEVYITEMGHQHVSMIDASSADKRVYLKTQEPVWQFVKNQFGEFVRLDSGIYRVIDEQFIKLEIKI